MRYDEKHGISDKSGIALLLGMVVVLALAIALSQYFRHDGSISNDTTHYLVGAASLLEKGEYSTRILYFDEHYASGTMPAPQTVWPPGTPASIAALAALGVPIEKAGRLWCVLAYPLLLVGLVLAVWCFTESIAAAAAAALWQLAIVEFWRYSSTIGSDLIYTTLTIAGIVIYAYSVRSRAERWGAATVSFPALTWISVLAGIAFFFRYAALFFIAWTMLLILLECANRYRRRSDHVGPLLGKALAAAFPALAVFVLLTVRNVLITGGLRGGNTKLVLNSVPDLAATTVTCLITALTGVNKNDFFATSLSMSALALVALIALGGLALSGLWRMRALVFHRNADEWRVLPILMTLALMLFYILGMIAISSRTMLSYGMRYLLPVVPLCILLGIVLWPRGGRMLCAGIALFTITQLTTLAGRAHEAKDPPPGLYREVTDLLAKHTQPEDIIMVIGDGQRIGYYGRRPTLAIPTPKYTATTWDEPRLMQAARRYGATYLVANRREDPERYLPFAGSLIEGDGASWLQPLQTVDSTFLYRIALGDQPAANLPDNSL